MRNKKQATPEPNPEQVAVERHVEALMNPSQPDAVVTETFSSSAAPIDIFQSMPADKVPLGGPAKTAPVVPGKPLPKPIEAAPTKSLFSSIDALNRRNTDSSPVPVSIKPKLTSRPIPIAVSPASTAVPGPAPLATPTTAQPKSISLGTNPSLNSGAATAVVVEKLARKDAFTDAATETAVAEIVAKEGDDLLAAEDGIRAQQSSPTSIKPKRGTKLRKIITSKWVLLLIPLIIVALFAVPYTRYKLAGLVIQKTLGVTVVDSTTGKPVSGAVVGYSGIQSKTNAQGQAMLQVPLGNGQLSISKGYYKTYVQKNTIGISDPSPAVRVNLVATGRQVPLTVLNKLTKLPLAGVTIKILGTSAVTDKSGKVTIALPTKTTTASATLTAEGYNSLTAEVQITDAIITANTVSLVPAGKLYFLSKTSGKIDVVKTNLDGSERAVVLAATGLEQSDTTSLIASKDWHYVVVKSSRVAAATSLYLIDTTTDKLTQFESTASAYTPIGWSGHNFVYDVVRSSQAQSQAGRESLKSYNADQQQPNQLDQTQAIGAATSYGYQAFNNFFIVDTQIVYNFQWNGGGTSGTPYDLTTQTSGIRTISASGSGKKDLQTYPTTGLAYVQAVHTLPSTIDYGVNTTDNKSTFYAYNSGSVAPDTTVTAATFNKTYPTYLSAPDGSKIFWNEQHGTKQALLLGDKNAASPATIDSGGEYTAYGWFTNSYLLLSRAGTGLYILPVSGEAASGPPIKVADYFQKATPISYGGGF